MKDWLKANESPEKADIRAAGRGKAGAVEAEVSSSSDPGISRIARNTADIAISGEEERSIAANGWVADLPGSFEVNQFSNIL